MLMIVFGEEVGLDRQNAIEIESPLVGRDHRFARLEGGLLSFAGSAGERRGCADSGHSPGNGRTGRFDPKQPPSDVRRAETSWVKR
jgi:hypothetical protein